ncbi:MAG: glycosyltransferase, partial [Anaerolineae bacterium]|nr:glycosyltransferase [Anaerolineae bacterium]
MRIVIMATGTRGDVQPMIALGKALQAQGHTVCLLAGSNFGQWIESHGLEAYPTVDMEALMRSELGIKWVESTSQLEQLKYMKALTNSIVEPALEDVVNGTQGAELLIGGFISEPYMQTLHEKHGIPVISIALQPYRATRSGAASLVPILAGSNSILNRWMGLFAERMTWSMAVEGTNKLRSRFGLPSHTAGSYLRAAHQIPALYAISPHVVPPIDDANTYT